MTNTNRYEMIRLIGKGGMGRVFLGRDTQTGTDVAIKVLPTDSLGDEPDLLHRLIREGEALRLLNHPNIVKMLDVVEERDKYSLILEYVEGGSLLDALKQQPQLPIETILKIALGVADGLTRAHQLRIIHRDIKPANILLAKDGTPRLTDFGLARMEKQQEITQNGMMIGSAAYLSPEVIRSYPPDVRMDIWAFGVVLYEMLAGRRPFNGDNTAAVLASIVMEPVPDITVHRADAPPVLIELITSMLEKNPDQRIASARRVGAAVEAILEKPGEVSNMALADAQNIFRPSARFSSPSKPSINIEEYKTVKLHNIEVIASNPPLPAPKPHPHQHQKPRLPLVIMALVVVVIGVALGIWYMNRDSNPPTGSEDKILTVDPVNPGEILVIVAQVEQLSGSTTRENVDRFIRDDLQQVIELSTPLTGIRIREYPAVVHSHEEAIQVAVANQAALVVWGNYTDEFIELEILTYDNLGTSPLKGEDLESTGTVRVRLMDERTQSVAPEVLISAAVWHSFNDHPYEASGTIVTYSDLEIEAAEVVGVTVGAYAHRYFAALYSEPATAVAVLDAAIQLDPDNPLLYHFRAAALNRLNEYDAAVQDVNTAILLTNNQWSVPFLNRASIEAGVGNNTVSITNLDRAIDLEPNNWLYYSVRGSFKFLEQDYEAAKIDLNAALENDPKANFPYVMLINIAVREGEMLEVRSLMSAMLQEFPAPTLGNRIVLSAGNQEGIGGFYRLVLTAFTNLALRQYDTALKDINAALEISQDMPELYLFQGIAYCMGENYEAAETAYTNGIAVNEDFTVLYLLRAETRRRLNNIPGALEDLDAAKETSKWANFEPLVAQALQGDGGGVGCEGFFTPQN